MYKKLSEESRLKRSSAARGRIVSPETRLKISIGKQGEPCKGMYNKAGPDHFKGAAGPLKDPSGRVWTVKNVSHFTRTHPELFAEEAVTPRTKKRANGVLATTTWNLASEGLRQVLRGASISWRGWIRPVLNETGVV